MTTVLASGLLLAAAFAVGPPTGSRSRLARLRGPRTPVTRRVTDAARRLLAHAETSRRLAVGGTALLAGVAGALGHGPVAGVVATAYAGLACHTTLSRRAAVAARRALTSALDGMAALVADLRAGVSPPSALGAAFPMLIGAMARGTAVVDDLAGDVDGTPRGRVIARLVTAWRLAESTGAPLADVLERLDGEVRAAERARALAETHAASARATAMLLAGLPLAGVGLGYGIGADPAAVLFGTPVGGACALLAVVLQLTGVAWARRLAQVDPERVSPPGAAR